MAEKYLCKTAVNSRKSLVEGVFWFFQAIFVVKKLVFSNIKMCKLLSFFALLFDFYACSLAACRPLAPGG